MRLFDVYYFYPMNFLAHAHLSGNDNDLMFGNFIADAVKGNAATRYKDQILKGIVLHREIDRFTDNHPVHTESRRLIREDFGKFAGIVVDIFYDHYLAKDWERYADVPLTQFVSHVYKQLTMRFFLLPDKTKRLLPFMISGNWLLNYGRMEGLERVFHGMDRRTGYLSGMQHATAVLLKHYESLQSHFDVFYPHLIAYVEQEMESLKK